MLYLHFPTECRFQKENKHPFIKSVGKPGLSLSLFYRCLKWLSALSASSRQEVELKNRSHFRELKFHPQINNFTCSYNFSVTLSDNKYKLLDLTLYFFLIASCLPGCVRRCCLIGVRLTKG